MDFERVPYTLFKCSNVYFRFKKILEILLNLDLETQLELQKSTVEELEKELAKVEENNKTKIQDEIKIEWEKYNTLSNEKFVVL